MKVTRRDHLYTKNRARWHLPLKDHNAPMAPAVAMFVLSHGYGRGYWNRNAMVLDPMAGVGTGLMVARLHGYAVTGIEIERHYFERLRDNMQELESNQKISMWNTPLGFCSLHHGDALKVVPSLPAASFDLVFTSPPYGDTLQPGDEGPFSGSYDLGKIKRGSDEWERVKTEIRENRRDAKAGAYGDTPGQLSVLPTDQFWLTLRSLFGMCKRVLKPGGMLVTVTKDYVKDGQRVNVADLTNQAAIEAGYAGLERVITTGAHGGQWKRIYNEKMRENGNEHLVVDTEDIQFYGRDHTRSQ
jgi:DNA modification methylase